MPPLPPPDLPLNALVQVTAGRGRIRYIGSPAFAPGKWIGVELFEPNGKNDGSVDGIRYFGCTQGHGVFVRSAQVKLIDEQVTPTPQPRSSRPTSRTAAPPPSALRTNQRNSISAPSSSTATPPPGRLAPPVSLARTLSTQSITRTQATQALPLSRTAASSPALPKPQRTSSSSSLASRAASPPKPAVPRTVPRPTPTTPRAVPSVPVRRSTLQTPLSTRTHSPSLSSTSAARSRSPPPSAVRIQEEPITAVALPPAEEDEDDSPSSVQEQPPAPARPEHSPILRRVGQSPVLEHRTRTEDPAPYSPAVRRSPSPPVHTHREVDELRAKVRVLEVKRADDAGRIRELETRLGDAEQFVALRPKLQAKLTSQQTELVELRRTVKDLNVEKETLESRVQEVNDQLEMALLDKEVAEERAETAESEMEDIKERLAESEVEREMLREEKALVDGDEEEVEEGKRSLAYVQLEKHNERLKEALLRLRDIAQESEREQRKKINELEREVASVEDIQSQYEMTLTKLDNAEAQIDDLKAQLDASLGAEDMVMQLTERVMALSEELAEKEIVIEDYETLKELNEELEETHLESEKQLQEDLEARGSELRSALARLEDQQDQIMEYENTIQQFRDAVLTLQADIEYLRNQQTTHASEAQALSSQSQAILALNMKLQTTVAKNQAKNIDLELRRLDASQAKEHLQIVQLFLPQAYFEADADATACYLFFERLAYKAELINAVVAQKYNLPESLTQDVSESLVGVCEMRGRIAHLSGLCRRFVAVLKRCDPEVFVKAGSLFPEIAGMEKRVDMHIERLRREEFKEEDCVSDVSKMLTQFEHLAETFFAGFHFALGEQELDLAFSIDYDLDTFIASLGLVQHAVSSAMQDPEIVFDPDDLELETVLFEPLNGVLAQARNARTAVRKIVTRIQDLVNDKAALRSNLIPTLGGLTEHMSKTIDFGIQLAQRVSMHVMDIRSAKEVLHLSQVVTMIRSVANEALGKRDASWDAVSETLRDLANEAAAFLPVTMEADSILRITGNAPWIPRVEEIRAKAAVNLEAEREVALLKEQIGELQRVIKTKDQIIQEGGVKMELMDRRMESLKKQAEIITNLEAELAKLRKSEASYQESLEQIQSELDAAEQEIAKLKTNGASADRSFNLGEGDLLIAEGTLETSQLIEQVDSLKGALRFLRSENSYLKGQGLLKEVNSLPPLEPVLSARAPILDVLQPPSLVADNADSDTESDRLATPPSTRTLAEATKHLYSDVLMHAATAKMVDLSKMGPDDGLKWRRRKDTPAYQLAERRRERDLLDRRVKGLMKQATAALHTV
ncbi:hypothetical protein DACRYDRAFT_118713 [Dacryopinax primogenitus]|uniref:CAP-Gly domain-containing protein n=1 Tax=Dacryopinax primogenitus (strain DJM 731) TaxID=1858805 RepID=M5G3U2_DACPD|nr:uncharacterized protein DACRYDRAFT_118713 [Dacryopinax primogenitus]EJT98432.1 hypothetical protein DACRYDRAFT_118713 [Dacryopinax primogenitus]